MLNPIVAHCDGIIQAAPESKALRAHIFNVVHKTKRPGAAYFLYVRSVLEIDNDPIVRMSEYRMLKIDAEIDPKSVVWVESHPLISLLYFHRLFYTDELFGGRLLFNPRRLQEENKRRG